MPRPIKCRKVEFFPEDTHFMPWGKRRCKVDEICVKIEELEAMRLKDIEGLNQEKCAEKMQISRQTFQNIIDSARKKVTLALTQGKAIHINGGNYVMGSCEYKCQECGKISIIDSGKSNYKCPSCGSEKLICFKNNKICNK